MHITLRSNESQIQLLAGSVKATASSSTGTPLPVVAIAGMVINCQTYIKLITLQGFGTLGGFRQNVFKQKRRAVKAVRRFLFIKY